MAPELTVAICVRNAAETIHDTIDSILRQDYDYQQMEMVVVDGSSSDSTLSIIRQNIEQKMSLQIFSDNGRGLGYARQLAATNARGKYVAFVDGDVVLKPNFFRKQLEAMRSNVRIGVGLGRYLYKPGTLVCSSWNLYQNTEDEFIGCAFVFRANAIASVHGFDEKITGASEDVDIVYRLRRNGWLVVTIEDAGFYHNYRSTVRGFWQEHRWFGYGGYWLAHKHGRAFAAWRNSPHAKLLYGLKAASRAYKVTRLKISFVIPVLLLIADAAWWSGYLSALGCRKPR
jgi:glycosyltransferase involved in cell wall biosynthesis